MKWFVSKDQNGNSITDFLSGCSGGGVMDREDASSVGEDEEQAEKVCRKDTPGPMPDHQYDRVSWSPPPPYFVCHHLTMMLCPK